MFGVFFLVAVFNLIVGYVLGSLFPSQPSSLRIPARWLLRRRGGSNEAMEHRVPRESSPDKDSSARSPSVAPTSRDTVESLPRSVPSAVEGRSDSTLSGTLPPPSPATDTSNPLPEPAPSNDHATDWETVEKELTKVGDRISYVRSIQDKTLAQETVEAFAEMLSEWYTRMSAQLEANETNPTMDDEESMQLELLVAQLETTLANLKCIDWEEDLDAIIERLEKEVRIIDGLRPAGTGTTA